MEKRPRDNSDELDEPSQKRARVHLPNYHEQQRVYEQQIFVRPLHDLPPNIAHPDDHSHEPAFEQVPNQSPATKRPTATTMPQDMPQQDDETEEIVEAEDIEVEQYHRLYLLQQEAYKRQQKQFYQAQEQRSYQAMCNLNQNASACRTNSGTRLMLQMLMDEVDHRRAGGSQKRGSLSEGPTVSPGCVNRQYTSTSFGRWNCGTEDDDEMYLE